MGVVGEGLDGDGGALGLAVFRRVKSAHHKPVLGTTRRNTTAPLRVLGGFAGRLAFGFGWLGLAFGVGVG
jgi:hypothetical protein